MKILNSDGLLYFWQKIKSTFALKTELASEATQNLAGLLSASDKVKLDGVESGAQANAIETVSVNGTALPVTAKGVNVAVPTDNSQLANGAGYQTAAQVAGAITEALGDVTQMDYQRLDTLPASGEKGVIYLIPHNNGERNIYDEYLWVASAFEKIGSTEIDLSGYVQSGDLEAITNAEIDAILTA